MKRKLQGAAALCLSLVLLLTACGGEKPAPEAESPEPSASQSVPASRPAEPAPPESAPAESVPSEPAPAEPAPSEPAPSEPASSEVPASGKVSRAESAAAPEVREFPEEPIPYDPADSTWMTITLEELPEDLETFASMDQMDLRRPQNTCAMFLCALNVWNRDRDQGNAAMDLLRGPRPMNDYDRQFLRDRMMEKGYLATAYFEGAAPENNYEAPAPYTLRLTADPRPQDVEEGYVRLYLTTAGADSPRPITLREKDGRWYLWEYSSILTGIRLPKAQETW